MFYYTRFFTLSSNDGIYSLSAFNHQLEIRHIKTHGSYNYGKYTKNIRLFNYEIVFYKRGFKWEYDRDMRENFIKKEGV